MYGRRYATATRKASATIAAHRPQVEAAFTLYLRNGSTVSGTAIDTGKCYLGRDSFVAWAGSFKPADYAEVSVIFAGQVVYLRDIEKISA